MLIKNNEKQKERIFKEREIAINIQKLEAEKDLIDIKKHNIGNELF